MNRATKGVAALAAAALCGAAVAIAVRGTPAPAAPNPPPVGTATVVRTDLASSVLTEGTLGYTTSPPVVNELGGTYTSVLAAGTVVQPGQTLFRVDNQAVVLMSGSTPAWRPFAPGMTDGPDVQELEATLIALGDAHGLFTVASPHYGAAAVAAVQRWQTALGNPATGSLDLGVVVFTPTPVRIAAPTVAPGQPAAPGDMPYQVTTTSRSVAVPLTPNDPTVAVGQHVSIQLPSGATTPGVVTAVGPPPPTSGSSSSGSGSSGSSGPRFDRTDGDPERSRGHRFGWRGSGPGRARRSRACATSWPYRSPPSSHSPEGATGSRSSRPPANTISSASTPASSPAARCRWSAGADAGHPGRRRPMNALELQGVTKEHQGTPPVQALRDVSLTVESGEFLAVTGPSGSGKSTLLAVAGTLERPTAGTVRVAGTAVQSMSDNELSGIRSSGLGFVFQQFHLLPTRSVLHNVADGLLYRGMPVAERLERAAEAVAAVGLDHRRTHRPGELSGGECQRTAIARAVVGEPALLLADEPTGNLDSATGSEIFSLLARLHERGTTILVVTHNDELARRTPRTVALRDGRIERDERR